MNFSELIPVTHSSLLEPSVPLGFCDIFLSLCVFFLLSYFNGHSTPESLASILAIEYFSKSALLRAPLWTSLHIWAVFFIDLTCSSWYRWPAYVAKSLTLLVGIERALWDQGSDLNFLPGHYNGLCVFQPVALQLRFRKWSWTCLSYRIGFGILSECTWQDKTGTIIVIAMLQLEWHQLDKLW